MLVACANVFAETPADVIQFLRSTGTILADAHEDGPGQFLGRFDRDMPNYAALRENVESLVARWEVGTAIEIVTDSGDEKRRVMDLDWLLEVQDHRPRRQIVKCTIEKRGKSWTFVALDPVDFFKF